MKRLIASSSFTKQEIDLLAEVLTLVLRGGDASMLARSPEFKNIACKQYVMSRRIKTLKEGIGGLRKNT